MLFTSSLVAVATLVSVAFAAPKSSALGSNPTATDPADVYAAQATAKSSSPTSHVKGKAFDRYVSIWFENTDYDLAAADPNFAWAAKQGITLENLACVTHPSEPNYMAVAGGDYFGLDSDDFTQVPENVSTVIDLLEDKGISWGCYQEDMPYTGFQGFAWVNQKTGANDYVRKHNPCILYNSVTNSPKRLEQIKNTTLFYSDLKANKLPQWIFVTPNMTSDGHDTSVTVAGNWLRQFLEPLLSDKNFLQNTLVLITFDENETYSLQNRVFSVLLGDAVPEHLHGTSDASVYTHYSELSTVEANWGLHTLGRYDVGANVFSLVGQQTGDRIQKWTVPPGAAPFDQMYFNTSYPGIWNDAGHWAPQPVPDIFAVDNGRTVLPSIQLKWLLEFWETPYKGVLEIPDGAHPPVYPPTFHW